VPWPRSSTTACLAIPASASATQPQTASKQTQSAGALAHERYSSSYGEREPPTVAQSPAPSDHTPWLPIALSDAVALASVAASTTEVRKLRIRRRAARVTS
jgi:hypothetical protein